jgi:adenine-specific DNA-methyltransferase
MDNFELLMHQADNRRVDTTATLNRTTQEALGQYFTHRKIAEFMARSFTFRRRQEISLLDPGAGVGVLTAAFIREVLSSEYRPRSITVLACEIDPDIRPRLVKTISQCHEMCRSLGVQFTYVIEPTDFIGFATQIIDSGLFQGERARLAFDYVIINPPYKKIANDSKHFAHLNSIGLHAPNLYAAFVLLASHLLCDDGGQLVAITPRSFCNGTYFKKFRQNLLTRGHIDHLHTFPSRNVAFSDNGVLQENVIFRFACGKEKSEAISVTQGNIVDDGPLIETSLPLDRIIDKRDPDFVIHIPTQSTQSESPRNVHKESGLTQLQIKVSTGKVVDFRTKGNLRKLPSPADAPLIYPQHFSGLGVSWPKPNAKKPNAIQHNAKTRAFMLEPGSYVVVKRFSAKEERRRIYAAVIEPEMIGNQSFAIENHVNYFHNNGSGIDPIVARGLAAFLSSTQLDEEFRTFSGHTQVNAGDLVRLSYPTANQLKAIGKRITNLGLSQHEIDKIVEEELEK